MKRPAFTLVELLIVMAIIGMLASITITAISPARQLALSRNTQRRSDVNTVLNGIYQYVIKNGQLPVGTNGRPISMTSTGVWLCKGNGSDRSGGCNATGTGLVLAGLTGTYLVSMPIDPKIATFTNTGVTGYKIKQDLTTSRVTVTAPHAELSVTISGSK